MSMSVLYFNCAILDQGDSHTKAKYEPIAHATITHNSAITSIIDHNVNWEVKIVTCHVALINICILYYLWIK